MVLDDLLEDLVPFRRLLLHDLLRPLHRLGDALLHQLVDDEGLEQFDRHRLGQAALVQPQLGTHHDDRPARVVHALAEQVLAEPALLALQHVGQRLEGPLAASPNRLGAAAVVEQRVHRLLQHLLLAMLAGLVRDGVAQFVGELVDVDPLEQQADRRRPDVRPERRVALGLCLVAQLEEAILIQQLALLHFLLARLDHHVIRVVDHPLEIAQRHVEQVAHRRRQRLEEPDVRHGHRELDVAHALAPHLGQRHLDAAAVADHAAIPDPLVLAAVALPVLDRAEDALAEEPIPFRLERPVVDRLGLRDFAPRPPRALPLELQALALLGVLGAPDLLGRGDPDLDIVKARALGLVAASEIDHYSSTSSVVPSVTFNPSAWSSFTSTLKDSGIPGFGRFCPFTIASYTRLRPFTSSDLTVRISCSVCAAPYASSAHTSISPNRWPPNCALPASGCWVTSEYGPMERAWILSSTRCDSFII